jgi:hypothetical protein
MLLCVKLYKCMCSKNKLHLHLSFFTQGEIALHSFTCTLICPKLYMCTYIHINVNEKYTLTFTQCVYPKSCTCTTLVRTFGLFSKNHTKTKTNFQDWN